MHKIAAGKKRRTLKKSVQDLKREVLARAKGLEPVRKWMLRHPYSRISKLEPNRLK